MISLVRPLHYVNRVLGENIYIGYNGLALGGVIIVTAKSEKVAKKIAMKYLEKQNCTEATILSLYLQCKTELKGNSVIYDWNGDY